MVTKQKFFSALGHTAVAATFLILAGYSLAYLTAPPIGFLCSPSGQITEIYVPTSTTPALEIGDRLLQVGAIAWPAYVADWQLKLYDAARLGESIPLLVERNGSQLSIPWTYPEMSSGELTARLISGWWLAYVFWATAALTLVTVRPRDTRCWSLIAFGLVTAIWQAAGSGPSRLHLWQANWVLRAAVWLSVPVYWQLHWNFPRALRDLPGRFWHVAYGIAVLLAAAEWFRLLPDQLYPLGLISALVGSAVMLALHAAIRPDERRDAGLLIVALVAAVLPTVIIGILGVFSTLPSLVLGSAQLTLPLLPLAYYLITYRRRIPDLEVRADPVAIAYLYATVLGSAWLALFLVVGLWTPPPSLWMLACLAISLLSAFVTGRYYGRFRSVVEQRLFGVRLPSAQLLERHAASIKTSVTMRDLEHLHTVEVLPSLLVRQAALLRCRDNLGTVSREPAAIEILYAFGLTATELPAAGDVPALLADAGHYRPSTATPCTWARLVLPLQLGADVSGLWLCGRRDPDDFYASIEIRTLQALADQTAVALANMEYRQQLQALYRADVNRQEAQLTRLARDLHDDLLNSLIALMLKVDERAVGPEFLEGYRALTARLRQTISAFRPIVMSCSLAMALNDLVEQLAEQHREGPQLSCDVPLNDIRYSTEVEEHLFRIAQQAMENAIRHACAHTVSLHGSLETDRVDLTIEDDGAGFAAGEVFDLPALMARHHYGLAGMYERAALIDAQVHITSAHGKGTQIRVVWAKASVALADGHPARLAADI